MSKPNKTVLVTDAIPCPKCGNPLTGHTGLSEHNALPNVGDVSICAWCATILEYTEGLMLAVMPDDKLLEFAKAQPTEFTILMEAQREFRNAPYKKIN